MPVRSKPEDVNQAAEIEDAYVFRFNNNDIYDKMRLETSVAESIVVASHTNGLLASHLMGFSLRYCMSLVCLIRLR